MKFWNSELIITLNQKISDRNWQNLDIPFQFSPYGLLIPLSYMGAVDSTNRLDHMGLLSLSVYNPDGFFHQRA